MAGGTDRLRSASRPSVPSWLTSLRARSDEAASTVPRARHPDQRSARETAQVALGREQHAALDERAVLAAGLLEQMERQVPGTEYVHDGVCDLFGDLGKRRR